MTEEAPSKKNKVLLVEDHPLFSERLAHLINKDLGMIVCGEADNIRDAMTLIQREKPDIAIVDLTLRGSSGLELIKDIKAQGIELPVLVLSMHEESVYAERVLRAGARGYITKHEASSEIILAIRRVLKGEIYASERVTRRILSRLADATSRSAGSGIELLSDRELEVYQMMGNGKNTREIAEMLHLGETTVDTYRGRIKEKLGIRNAAELYQRAAQWVKEQGS